MGSRQGRNTASLMPLGPGVYERTKINAAWERRWEGNTDQQQLAFLARVGVSAG